MPLAFLLRFARRQPVGVVSALAILLVVAAAVLAPHLRTVDPNRFSSDVLQPPSSKHWFGTTREGWDVYSRVIYGARVSLAIGGVTVVISIAGGTVLALIAGTIRGMVDLAISRAAEIIFTLPSIVTALVVVAVFGSSTRGVVLAISVLFTPSVFRVMRSQVYQQYGQVYVEAARALGASQLRVMVRHLLPNVLPLMIVLASATLPAAILTQAGLAFLGVGGTPGLPSWGSDLSGTARQYFQRAPWLAIFPGLALSTVVLAFNLLGDALRDALDPRLRGRL